MSDNVVKFRQEEEKIESKDATAISFAGAASIFVGTIGLFGGAYTGVYATEILGAMLGVAGGFQFFQILISHISKVHSLYLQNISRYKSLKMAHHIAICKIL